MPKHKPTPQISPEEEALIVEYKRSLAQFNKKVAKAQEAQRKKELHKKRLRPDSHGV